MLIVSPSKLRLIYYKQYSQKGADSLWEMYQREALFEKYEKANGTNIASDVIQNDNSSKTRTMSRSNGVTDQ